MIGIDRSDTVSSIVRQFSCSFCYRYWWRRVRLYKQVFSIHQIPIFNERDFHLFQLTNLGFSLF